MSATIVLTTFGSLGDLHPFIALALGLQARGHRAMLASSAFYRETVERAGLQFHAMRPDYDPTRLDLHRQMMHRWRGTEAILRHGVLPVVRETYADLLPVARLADLLVGHPIVFPVPLIAEQFGIPWANVVLAPISLFSAHQPPVPFADWWFRRIWSFGPAANRAILDQMRSYSAPWCRPLYELRAELGLPPGGHPLFEGQHSPHLTLALFSPAFAQPQPDWPSQVRQTGFLFHDSPAELPAPLEDFLTSGPAPIVFTLGSAAVLDPGEFFRESARAAQQLGYRAVLLAGPQTEALRQEIASAGVFVTRYAPYGLVVPRAAAVVHQGGIGTTAQTLRAGVPALIVPFAHDQPDNALRVRNLGAGLVLPQFRYTTSRATRQLSKLLGRPTFRQTASRIGDAIQAEHSVWEACDAIDRLLATRSAVRVQTL